MVGRLGTFHTPCGNDGESTAEHRLADVEMAARVKPNPNVTWLRDETLDDTGAVPSRGVLAAETVEDLAAARVQLAELAAGPPLQDTRL
jgi:hypothetical protein